MRKCYIHSRVLWGGIVVNSAINVVWRYGVLAHWVLLHSYDDLILRLSNNMAITLSTYLIPGVWRLLHYNRWSHFDGDVDHALWHALVTLHVFSKTLIRIISITTYSIAYPLRSTVCYVLLALLPSVIGPTQLRISIAFTKTTFIQNREFIGCYVSYTIYYTLCD